MKRALAFAIGLPVLSAIGAYFVSNITPYITIASIALIFLLVLFNKLDKKYYPFYLFGLSLALLWGTSMLGQHIVGNDIHGEYFITTWNMTHGWDIFLHNGNNTSLTVGGIAPLLGKMGFDPIWQYKALYPFCFAFAPVLLYFAYRKLFGERIGFLSNLFIIIMPMFTLDMTSHAKGMIAELCLAAIPMLLICDMKLWQRIVGLNIAIIGAIINHYTIGNITLMYFIGMIVIISIVKLIKPFNKLLGATKLKWQYSFATLALVVAVMSSYYGVMADGAMLGTLNRVRNSLTRIFTITMQQEQVEEKESTSIDPVTQATQAQIDSREEGKQINLTDQYLQGAYDKRTQPIEVTGTYLDKQEQTIRTALGLDFPTASIIGKIFRILQLVSEILIGIGTILMFWKWRKIPLEYKALVLTGFGILLACLFIPYISTTVSATRFYQVALFFLAPAFVLGLEWVFKKRIIVTAIFLAYFAFTSGLVFEITQDTVLDKVNIPYSLALSNYRLNISGMYNDNDIEVAKWLATQGETTRYSDYNGIQLMLEYNPIGIAYRVPEKPYYVFSTSWSTQHNTFIAAKVPGLRMYRPIPEEMKAEVYYQQGDAIVYIVR